METEEIKRKNEVIGSIAITINLFAFMYKGMYGTQAGWEYTLPAIVVGLILTIITIIKERNAVAWTTLTTVILALVVFLWI